MTDITRPFTEEEFDKVFHDAGYHEIARQYCREEFDENMKEAVAEISDDEFENEQECLIELKQYNSWTADTAREQAWYWVKEYSNVDFYVQQRQIGHGHEWAKLYCLELGYDPSDKSQIYSRVYQRMCDRSNDNALAVNEVILDLKYLAKEAEAEIDDEVIEYYIKNYISNFNGQPKDLFKSALYFNSIYDGLIKDGCDKPEALKHAKNLCDGNEHHQVFNDVYRQAIHHRESPSEARSLAAVCEYMVVNDYLYLESNNFRTQFTEPWQQDIYEKLLTEYEKKSAGFNSINAGYHPGMINGDSN